MAYRHKCSSAFISALFLHLVTAQSFNPSILQDSRDLPKVDGTFGFLYRTEDGIAHAAKGDSDGVIHGRFSYTDPTGLKVNYNYNAGSRVTPGYNYDDTPTPKQPTPRQYQAKQTRPTQTTPKQYQPEDDYSEPQQYNDYEERPRYQEPQPQYVPRTRPSAGAQRRPSPRPQQYSDQYREPAQSYQQPRTRRPYATHNEVYEDYY
jgi:hypothetical protein